MNIFGMLKNPMVLMMLFSAGMMYFLPKLMVGPGSLHLVLALSPALNSPPSRLRLRAADRPPRF
jgi:hypothetical protein